VVWERAIEHCDTLNLAGYGPGSWHLPTISELRSLVRGCPGTETGGSCGVTNECLSEGACYFGGCNGCAWYEGPGEGGLYTLPEFGSIPPVYWSSSPVTDIFDAAWLVGFTRAEISRSSVTYEVSVRCVRDGP
jgi:hypothetical protein